MFQKLLLFKRMQALKTQMMATGASAGAAEGGSAPALPAAAMQPDASQVCRLPPSHVDAGCTAIVACVRQGVLYVANAGDSRAVLCRAGAALPLSEDHKPALAGEEKRIMAAGGFVTPQGRINGNLNLSRALGDLK